MRISSESYFLSGAAGKVDGLGVDQFLERLFRNRVEAVTVDVEAFQPRRLEPLAHFRFGEVALAAPAPTA